MVSESSGTNVVSPAKLSETEKEDIEEHLPQRTPVIFEIVRRTGAEELDRPWISLWWSGIAAGISIGFSILAEALLHDGLKGVPGAQLIEKLGYTVGFVIIILAHQQLFTENILTAVVPLMAHFHKQNLIKFLRLWGTVLLANVIGTALFAYFLSSGLFLTSSTTNTIHELSMRPFSKSALELFASGIVAGFIMASLVWMLANMKATRINVIILMTYLISLGDFSHVIAGSVEASYVVITGSISFANAIGHFFIPTLLGNVVGGTGLFAMLAYGQAHRELASAEQEA